jgi:hypothetical protein
MGRLAVALNALDEAKRSADGRYVVSLSQRIWDVPLQVAISKTQVADYVSSLYSTRLDVGSTYVKARMGKILSERADDRKIFPLKLHTGAKTKVNMFFGDLFQDARAMYPDYAVECLELIFAREECVIKRQCWNDEAAAWLVWLLSCKENDLDIRSLASLGYDALKEMSNVVKGLGVAGSPLLHLLAEPHVLIGRGAKEIDWDDELDKRTNPYSRAGMLAVYPTDVLRTAVAQVVREERIGFKPPVWKDAWNRRFSTTKAGSHAAWAARDTELPKRQLTRRNYVEALQTDEVTAIKPGGQVTASGKLENGATRAIYSLDSDNYLRFDSPARALEDCWKNKRAVLRPAAGLSSLSIEKRAAQLRTYNMMFDYTAFTSAHTLEAMKIVVEFAFAGLEEEWHKWLIDSFDNMWVKDPRTGEQLQFRGTLPSGHRLTTIINTILNAAYMRIELGGLYNHMYIEHVGDDVVASTYSMDVAELAVNLITKSRLNINPSKQGFGTVCAEFLRVSFTKTYGVGYFCRTIASGVSGSWVTTKMLSTDEYTESVANLIWTWRQRSQSTTIPLLWMSTLMRRLKLTIKEARAVCEGSASLNGSPIWSLRKRAFLIKIKGGDKKKTVPRKIDGKALPRYAANDFKRISKEYKTLITIGVGSKKLDEAMLEASYGNFCDESDESPYKWETKTLLFTNTLVRKSCRKIHNKYRKQPGMLISALKNRLTDRQWAMAGAILGFDHRPFTSRQPLKISGFALGTPYSDARETQKIHRSNVSFIQAFKIFV